MAKKMLIDATHPEETRVVVVDGSRIEEFDYETITKVQISGNIYLAKVTRVEPSLQAAFVEYGGGRHGFLAFSEVHPDYYQIPVADREALLAAERAAARDDDFDDDETDKPVSGSDRRKGRRGGRSERRAAEASDDAPRDRRRRGRRRDGGRRKALTLAPLSDEITLPEQAVDADWSDALRVEAPARSALDALAETVADVAPTPDPANEPANAPTNEPGAEADADAPDLSDVDEIVIRRAPSEAEAAAGLEVVVETIAVGDGSGEAQAQAEEAAEAPEAATKAAAVLAEAAGAPAVAAVSEVPEIEADAVGEEAVVSSGERDEDADAPEDGDEDGAASGEIGEAVAEDGDIEEFGADDAREEVARPRRPRLRDYRIQEVIKRRQIMLVQVVKEERGTKGAALTTYLSLAGRYCVLMPNTARGGGISRKITNAADRKRLKAVAQEMEVPDGMGLIVRTAGANRTKAEIKRDFEYLLRQWAAIRDLTLKSVAPTLIYEEGSLIKRAIRDLYNKDIEAILVEGDEGYREAKDYMKMLMPSHAKHVQPYREMSPLFSRHQVESQIGAMMNPSVPLKSGGYLVIGVTEALVAIDVNSGRATKEGSIEETALKTNLEAAEEAARQMRLRDLAGLIVIDFIDMEESKNNRAVEKRLKDKLKDDRARIQLGRISGFGLLEMSRQRLRPGLLEATTTPCPHCRGSGLVRSEESMALTILRAVEEEGARGRSPAVRVAAPVSIANYLMNQKRARLGMIEERHHIQLIIEGDPALLSPEYAVERVKPIEREEPISRAIQVEAGYSELEEFDEEALEEIKAADAAEEEAAEEDAPRRRRRRRKDRDDRGDDGAEIETAADADEDDEESEEPAEAGDAEEEPRKRRGRRGGRRRRRRDEEGGEGEPRDPLPVIDVGGVSADPEDEEAAETAAPREVATTEEGDAPDQDISAVNGAEPEAPREEIAPVSAAPERPEERDAPPPAPAEATSPSAEPPAEPAPAPAPPVRDPSQPRRTGWWSFRRSSSS